MAGAPSHKTRVRLYRDEIAAALDAWPSQVLSKTELSELLDAHRQAWKLGLTTTEKFYSLVSEILPLTTVRLEFPYRPITRYCWRDVDTLELTQSIHANGYFSHYTAISVHGLTEQVPKTIYFNIEQNRRPGGGHLNQGAIDRTFKGKMRLTSNVATIDDRQICLLNGGNTDCLGVETRTLGNNSQIRVTDIERTLIDATIRPAYSGGVFEVRRAFEAAKDSVSINRLCSYLRTINYTYPYHQLVGFYLQRAEYRESQLKLLKQFPMEYDFYLDYGLKSPGYDSTWKVFFPKNFE